MAIQCMGNVDRRGPEGAQMLAEVMPTIYLEKKKNMTPKELLELLSLEICPSLGPEQFSLPQCPISPEVGGKQTGGH